jgi:hypothetical protein
MRCVGNPSHHRERENREKKKPVSSPLENLTIKRTEI